MKTWNLSVKRKFQINNGECLIDPNYKYKSNLILDKDEYNTALSKHYLLSQLLRFLGWLSALDIAKKIKKGEITNDSEGFNPIDLKKEAAGILFMSSQKFWKIKENPGTNVQGVECFKLRLVHRTAKSIFGTDNIPMVSQKDPLTAKIIRNAHLANKDGPA